MGAEVPLWLMYMILGTVLTPLVVIGSALMVVGGVVVYSLWPRRRKKRGGCTNGNK